MLRLQGLEAQARLPRHRLDRHAPVGAPLSHGCSDGVVRAGLVGVAGGSPIAQQLALSMLPGEESVIDVLSQRELQVLIMISQGMRTNEISKKLNLSQKTVSTYRKRLHDKLDVSNDVEMMHLAIKHGLLDEDEQ